MEMNGGQSLIRALEMEGVEVMFGLPGGAILPVYDPVLDSTIRHILVRHEQGAGHMAEGYAHATGRPGVAMVTSGPGATNIVTPLADAYMDSVPMVCITGQVPLPSIGTDAFQECDITGITQSVTKHNFLVTKADDIPLVIRQAFHLATTGRPGPVLVDIPKDIVDPTNPSSATSWDWPTDAEVAASLPGYRPATSGEPEAIERGRGHDPRRPPTGHLRRRRHPQGPGGRGPARAGRAARRPRRHHADGPGRLPRLAPALPRHAGDARQLHRRHRAAAGRPADHPRCPLRRPGHRQGRRLRARGQGHPRRHRRRRARQGPPPRRADPRRLPPHHRGHGRGDPPQAGRRRREPRPHHLAVDDQRLAGALPAGLRAAGRRRPAQAPDGARAPAGLHPRRHDPRLGRRPAPDVGQPVLEVRPPLHVGELRRPRHHGLLGAGGHRGQGRSPGPHGLGRRRRRLLPDDGPGARHRLGRAHPREDRHPEQRLPRHGPPVAGDVLRGALLRGVPVAGPARLRPLGGVDGLRRHPGRVARGDPAGHRQGQRHRRPARRGRVPHRQPRRRCSRWCPRARPTTTSRCRPSRRATGSAPARAATDGRRHPRHPARRRARTHGAPPRPVGAGREPLRRARPGRQPVLPPGLQHRLPRGGAHRGRAASAGSPWWSTSSRLRSSRSSSSSTS